VDVHLILRFRFVQLRVERVGLHLHEQLPRFYKIAFFDQDFFNPGWDFSGYIDIGRLNPAVAADDNVRLRMKGSPRKERADCDSNDQRDNDGCATPVRRLDWKFLQQDWNFRH
jgi:hypothetical protein